MDDETLAAGSDMDCPHIDDAVQNLDVEDMRMTLKNKSCNVCLRVDQLCICMECSQILCGRDGAGHGTAHFKYHEHHCITLNIESAAIFCYKCDTEVYPKNHHDELNRLRQFILYNQGPSKVNKNKKRQKKQQPQPVKEKKICSKKKVKKPTISKTNSKKGLDNLGNTCFMNATLQSLSHMYPLVYCLKHIPEEYLNNNNNNPRDPKDVNISEELIQILTSLSEWKKPSSLSIRSEPIAPKNFYKLICQINHRYRGYHQHDAHEFLIFTLNKLHSELKQLMLEEEIRFFEQNSTIVHFMFGGLLLSEVCCLRCNLRSRTCDPILDLSLDVPDYSVGNAPPPDKVDTLNDCLSRYIEIEELNENNFYSCLNCNSAQRSTKKFWLYKLPNILCLHLKRFRFQDTQRIKVHTHIKFPLISLDMSHYLSNDVHLLKEEEYLFDLMAVVVHEGNGGGSGHYTSFALDDSAEKWYQYNDHKVHLVEDISVVLNSQAYILFYIKREMRLRMNYFL